MTKTGIVDVISSRIDSLDSMIGRLEKNLLDCNGDHLMVNNQRGVTHFYVATDEGARKHVTDRTTISEYAKKRYDSALLKAAMKERRQLQLCMKHLDAKESNSDVEKVFDSLPSPIKEHITPDGITDEGYAAEWLAKYSAITGEDRFHIFKTIRGDYVRSKSEAIIADRLFSLGIPYAYEKLGLYDDERFTMIHPDFLVLNKAKRKEYVWEHCGMMDESKYCNDSLHRLKVLSKHGYIQGKNLLFSYESKETPLNMALIEKLIEEHFI